MKARKTVIGAGVTFALAVLSTAGNATTYNFSQVSGGSCCGLSADNFVQVSDTTVPNGNIALATGVFGIHVALDSSLAFWSFQKNGGDKTTGHAASFAFSSDLATMTLSNITSPFFANSVNPMGAFAMSPWSFPATGYGVSQNTSNDTVYNVLDFLVNTGTTDTLAQFILTLNAGTGTGLPNIVFAADVQDGTCGLNCGNTGVIGFSFLSITQHDDDTTPQTPIPGALPLFATGLGALGLLTWRRKRKAVAA